MTNAQLLQYAVAGISLLFMIYMLVYAVQDMLLNNKK